MLAAGVPALARDEPPQIVVEGERRGALESLSEVRALSRESDGHLARFEKPVCPGVAGMPGRYAAAIVRRMRESAGDLGVELAPEGCDPNITVIVTDDGAGLIDGLARKSPAMFGYMSSGEIARLRRSAGPTWTWQATRPSRADGGPVQMIDQISLGSGPPRHTSKGAYAVPGASLSRLSSPVRRDTELAFVVLSEAAIAGKSIAQLADYAILRGLASTKPNSQDTTVPRSIGSLFSNGDDAPAGLTAFDRAYLGSLYSGPSNLTYLQKTRAIASDVAAALDH